MSEFSDNMALAWASSARVFGDTIVIGALTFTCVVHDLSLSTEVENGRPGRQVVLSGSVVMQSADWVTAGGAKGTKVTVGGAEARVLNDPNVGYTADTVTLVLGPRT